MELSVKLETFEGPLDLLLHLIDKNKVNIYDIPIAEITNQYMDYLDQMKRQDLNIMSEFLVMAATLLSIKARMLLPAEENEEGEEEDPRQELVEKLLEYKMYKSLSLDLRDRMMDAEKALFKPPTLPEEIRDYQEPVDVEALLGDLTLARLHEVFQSVLKRQEDKIDPVRSRFGKLEREEVSLSEKLQFLDRYARERGRFSFLELLEGQRTKMHKIVTFLAVLELVKGGRLHVCQQEIFGDIDMEYTGEGPLEAWTEDETGQGDGGQT